MTKTNYKIIFIGDTNVGKSSIFNWIMYGNQNYHTFPTPTLGASFSTKEVQINGNNEFFHLWDTAGQERFRSIVRIYYKHAIGCICVFDLTNRQSFLNLRYWLNDFHDHNDIMESKIIIVANKSDYDKTLWTVNEKDIVDLSKEYNCDYIYTNCIDGQNINLLFQNLVSMIINDQSVTSQKKDGIINLYFRHIKPKLFSFC